MSNNLQLGVSLTVNQYFPIESKIISASYPLNLTTTPNDSGNVVETVIPQGTPGNDIQGQITATLEPSPTQPVQIDLSQSQTLPAWLGITAGVILSLFFIVLAFILIRNRK